MKLAILFGFLALLVIAYLWDQGPALRQMMLKGLKEYREEENRLRLDLAATHGTAEEPVNVCPAERTAAASLPR